MNRTDRLFAITARLLGREVVRAEDLADTFEVSKRTIYRDIAALSEAGVPVVSLPGQGYSISAGYVLPPLNLTHDEGLAMLVGARLVRAAASGPLQSAASSGLDKILAVLGETISQPARDLDRTVEFSWPSVGAPLLDLSDPRLSVLREAILARNVVRLAYTSKSRAQTTTRSVEPEQLAFANGVWYLTAHCRLRDEERVFRLDRVDSIVALPEQFSRRPKQAASPAPGPIEATVFFRESTARWVRERQHWACRGETGTQDGVVFTYALETLDDIITWLLGWGTAATPLSPLELRDRLRDEARAVMEMLT